MATAINNLSPAGNQPSGSAPVITPPANDISKLSPRPQRDPVKPPSDGAGNGNKSDKKERNRNPNPKPAAGNGTEQGQRNSNKTSEQSNNTKKSSSNKSTGNRTGEGRKREKPKFITVSYEQALDIFQKYPTFGSKLYKLGKSGPQVPLQTIIQDTLGSLVVKVIKNDSFVTSGILKPNGAFYRLQRGVFVEFDSIIPNSRTIKPLTPLSKTKHGFHLYNKFVTINANGRPARPNFAYMILVQSDAHASPMRFDDDHNYELLKHICNHLQQVTLDKRPATTSYIVGTYNVGEKFDINNPCAGEYIDTTNTKPSAV